MHHWIPLLKELCVRPSWVTMTTSFSRWWFQPIWKNLSQIESSPQVRVKMKNNWNHQLVLHADPTPQKNYPKKSCPKQLLQPPFRIILWALIFKVWRKKREADDIPQELVSKASRLGPNSPFGHHQDALASPQIWEGNMWAKRLTPMNDMNHVVLIGLFSGILNFMACYIIPIENLGFLPWNTGWWIGIIINCNGLLESLYNWVIPYIHQVNQGMALFLIGS